MNRVRVLLAIIGIAVFSAGAFYFFTTPRYSNTEHHVGNLVVDDVLEITDTRFIIEGNIIVRGDGKLIVRDSELRFNQESNSQYFIQVGEWGSSDSPELYLENVVIDANGKWMYVTYSGSSKATIIDCKDGDIPWHSAGNNVEVTLRNTKIGFTMADNVTMKAEDCALFLEFVLRNCSGVYSLPLGDVDELDFEFEMGRETLRVETTGCRFREWGVTLDHLTNITYVDTKITIGMNAGSAPMGAPKLVELSGLKAKKYDEFEVDYDTNHVKLIDSEVVSWYPQAFNGVTVEIDDSDLADVQWNGGNSTIIIRDSHAYIAVARQNVTYRFIDSVIDGDVTASGNSSIYLDNTRVGGKINEYDTGRVFIDGDPYEG